MVHTKKLPLHPFCLKLGAKIGAFGDWEVPLYFSSVIEEHQAVRKEVGIFDISHMGEVYFEGPTARQTLDRLVTNKIEKLIPGKALYSPMCNEKGGIVDDLVVYELKPDSYLVVVNAANISKDYCWFLDHCLKGTTITNQSDSIGLLSVQGPKSLDLLKGIFSDPIEQLSYYTIMPVSSRWPGALVSRTGYTGEFGFEIFLETEHLEPAYSMILDTGKQFGIKPIGFGARDTLRLEACMLLYGQDMNDDTTPLEAGLERTVCFEKEFIGKEALLQAQANPTRKRLVGFEMIGHGLARHDYSVCKDRQPIGRVTSGSFSPTLKKNIGLAYVAPEKAAVGSSVEIEIRSNFVEAKIVQTPFYKRSKRS